MQLLIDTDAFCKLGICGLLERVVGALGDSLADARRLPALPYMLKRGKLAKRLGEQNCETLQGLAATVGSLVTPDSTWLNMMSGITDVDPGEAAMFAACIEHSARMVTGDKRAIRAVSKVLTLRTALGGRLVTMEAALLALGKTEDLIALKPLLRPAAEHDTMLRVCFSEGTEDPGRALRSYLESFATEVGRELLWRPDER